MDVVITTVAAAVLLAIAVAAGVKVYQLWRAGMRERPPLLMHRVLQHEGVELAACADEGRLVQVAAAARRCLLCRDRETCVAWLEGDSGVPLDHFCPNAELITQLRVEK